MALRSSGVYFDASAFRVLRLFRILQLEHFVSAFTLLDDVWSTSKDTLAATGLLALVVWVGSACLFYLFEKVRTCAIHGALWYAVCGIILYMISLCVGQQRLSVYFSRACA